MNPDYYEMAFGVSNATVSGKAKQAVDLLDRYRL
jgi:hypothetical protein